MKKIANFGEWVIDFWWLLIPMFVGIATAIYCYNGPKTVMLDAKHFECTMAVPDGIGTKCIEYTYKGK
jgi:hypothetical protein